MIESAKPSPKAQKTKRLTSAILCLKKYEFLMPFRITEGEDRENEVMGIYRGVPMCWHFLFSKIRDKFRNLVEFD